MTQTPAPPPFGATPVCGRDGGPVPVTMQGGSVTLGAVTIPAQVTVGNAPQSPVNVGDGGGSLTVDDGGNSLTVDGPLTNQELRATPVVVGGPLTNSELRATPVVVGGPLTNSELRATPVAVGGPLTNAELRASPINVAVGPRTPTTISVPGADSSVLLLPPNTSRRGLMVNNQSTSKLYLSFSNPASAGNSFLKMDPDGFLLLDQQMITTNAIYGIWTSSTGSCQITEFVL
jgi:hypothetical protein